MHSNAMLPPDDTASSGPSTPSTDPTRARHFLHSQASALIHAPLGIIWELMTAFDRWPAWNPAIQQLRTTTGAGCTPGAVFVWKSGGVSITSTVRTVRPRERLTWSGRAFGTQALHDWQFVATEAGVLVRTAEQFSGWLPRLVPELMQAKLDDSLPRWLSALKREAESG